MLKKIVVATVLTFSCMGVAVAQQPPAGNASAPNPAAFSQMKATMIDNHQKRIQVLQQGLACIQAATTPPAMQACTAQERGSAEQLRGQMGAPGGTGSPGK